MHTPVARLRSEDDEQIWACPGGGMPVLIHWGQPLPEDEDLQALWQAWRPPLPHGGLDLPEWPSWLPEAGTGFSGTPGLQLRREGRRCLTQCRLQRLDADADGLLFVLEDALAGVQLQLSLQARCGGFVAQASLRNSGTGELEIEQLASLCLPLPADAAERWTVGGHWAAEFQAERAPLNLAPGAGWWRTARTGRGGHHAHPSLTLLARGACQTQGAAWSAQLAWSGNHSMGVEAQRLGGALVWLGEHLLPGEVRLAPDAEHRSPAVHLRRSSQGLRALALGWHRQVRSLLPAFERPRAVQFNTWEAVWFDHRAEHLMRLAEAAAELGVERFVLDDGWFAGRRDDRAGLGDWWPCPERFPEGLGPLAAHCRRLGMDFGLWVEPESVSPGSALLQAHPDWALQEPGRVQPLGRQQYVLDLGRPEVREHLFERLAAVLRSAPIVHLKWDMNRDFTHEHGAQGRPGVRAHVLGLYALQQRLREVFPDLEIETCASGGARADLGALQQACRVWVSDCHDPMERQGMQAAFLQLLPPELMGSHIGPLRSHQTGRAAPAPASALTALMGSLGLERDLLSLAPDEREALRTAVQAYKVLRTALLDCDVTALDSDDPGLHAVWACRRDGQGGWLSLFQSARAPQALSGLQRLPGLRPERRYAVRPHPTWPLPLRPCKEGGGLEQAGSLRLSGQALAHRGLRLPLLWPGDGCLLELQELKP